MIGHVGRLFVTMRADKTVLFVRVIVNLAV